MEIVDLIFGALYLLAGVASTFWVEGMFVDQGYGNELGLAFTFGDRMRSIVLWPIFTGEYLIDFAVIFSRQLLETLEGNDQQQT